METRGWGIERGWATKGKKMRGLVLWGQPARGFPLHHFGLHREVPGGTWSSAGGRVGCGWGGLEGNNPLSTQHHTRDAERMPCALLRSVTSDSGKTRRAGWVVSSCCLYLAQKRRWLELGQVCTPEDERGEELGGA